MSQGVRDGQLRRIADVVDAGVNSPRVPGRLADPVLRTLAALVPCDSVTFGDLEPATGTHYALDEVIGEEVSFLAEPSIDPADAFWQHYDKSLHCSYPTRTGDDRTVTMRSDFYTTREWLKEPMYIDVLSEWHFAFELMCPLPNVAGRSKRLLFFRSGSYDFTEEDRFALALLRPHVIEMVGRGRASAVAQLTERQTELLRLVAEGFTNAEIASALHLSPHTVRTHLTNIFERLGVTTRAAAVARVLST
jgi:DNA-binding CsgD family transcriptional regulator